MISIYLNLGMRKDFINTPEEKLLRQQRIEENRRLRSDSKNSQNTPETIVVNVRSPAVIDKTISCE